MEPSHARWRSISAFVVLAFSSLCALGAPGDLDATFGQHGRVHLDVPGSTRAFAQKFFTQSDGKIVAVGSTQGVIAGQDFLIVRFNADGTPDTTFDGDGIVVADFNGATAETAFGVAQQPDGKLVVVGVATISPGTHRMAVLRLTTSGQLDGAFGTGGKALVALGSFAQAIDVFVEAGGKLVLAGHSDAASAANIDFTFARIDGTTGMLDPTFGASGGYTAVDFFGGFDFVRRAIRQQDGKYLAVGSAGNYIAQAAARVDANGIVDIPFNATGRVFSNCTVIAPCEWQGVAQQPDGKL